MAAKASKLALALTAAVWLGLPAMAAVDAPPLVSAEWLKTHLNRDDIIILDIRSPYADSGKPDYLKGHIPGALWSEYPGVWRTERDGVEGMLPSVEKLEASLSELGVTEEKTVVIVPAGKDSQEFGGAARIYWTLKQLGQPSVTILDGGHSAWTADASNPIETGDVTPEGDMFIAEADTDMVVSDEQVKEQIGTRIVMLDGRPHAQFIGNDKHSNAKRAGRIPGSVNLDQDRFFDAAKKRLRPPAELAAIASSVVDDPAAEIVSYCNTGHWSATNWFVLHELLGYENVSLYDASMVGWSANPALPMEIGEAVGSAKPAVAASPNG
ncbi:sulfurtransferase [Breoghania sp. L-A4]|nr:sulfurtransferase [Breoghania sp. L-A4]